MTTHTTPAPVAPVPPVPPSAPAAGAGAPGLSIASLAVGLASIFMGWIVLAPIAGLVLGILGLRREPRGRTMAVWGIVLNSCVLGLAAFGLIALVVFGLVLPAFALPFADPTWFDAVQWTPGTAPWDVIG